MRTALDSITRTVNGRLAAVEVLDRTRRRRFADQWASTDRVGGTTRRATAGHSRQDGARDRRRAKISVERGSPSAVDLPRVRSSRRPYVHSSRSPGYSTGLIRR